MSKQRMKTVDGNTAAGSVAYRTSEVIAIYPITPSSTMGEVADELSGAGARNIWGAIPQVTEMQSEAGAAGAVHGALQAGALATTFTASQGLLLMIPNMYKIAGELTAFCMHVTARALATHALSIFGDHSDIYACRQTGFAMLSSANVQEAQDFAAISHAATLRSRIPFMHFFDGFRTSHEVAKIEDLGDEILTKMIPTAEVEAHRNRAMTPDHPVLRGTAQNPDTFFQAREACNSFYDACPAIVQREMDRFAELTGRRYHLFDYVGDPEATRVVVIMGSGGDVTEETVAALNKQGGKVGVLKVRLYRPLDARALIAALPATTKAIAVLDRTKEPGSIGEPLLLDLLGALHCDRSRNEPKFAREPLVIGGRYGLASKEFTPAMVKAIFDELAKPKPKARFTVGIVDDVTHLSLPVDDTYDIEPADVKRAVFFGLGADGTVGANKNSIKIIGHETEQFAQGYFVYDSKKSGAITISHLRFGPRPIRSAYLIRQAEFVACHQFGLLEKHDVISQCTPGGTLLINVTGGSAMLWNRLSNVAQQQIIDKKLRVFAIDAGAVAAATGMGGRINTIMQTCFFALAKVLPVDQAIAAIKHGIEETYSKKGPEIVKKNCAAVDEALKHMHEVVIPEFATGDPRVDALPDEAPDFVKRVTAMMMAGKGDLLPVSAFPVDGTWPLSTSKWEKRGIALNIPVWEPGICIQCNKCAMACPHAAIRANVYSGDELYKAPETFKSCDYKGADMKGQKYTIQVAPDDCTGCNLCVMVCPAKDKTNPRQKAINMSPRLPIHEKEAKNYDFFLNIPEPDRSKLRMDVKGTQFLTPLFEYSGACAGCGETPYVRLMTQLFGDRMMIANATGCSSIYGGNLPTTPYCTNKEGRGPAWSNSLFEDNAEFGLGMRLALDAHVLQARELLINLAPQINESLVTEILQAKQENDTDIKAQRERIGILKTKLANIPTPEARRLLILSDYLVKKDVWIVGGDGWAYDIGFGGLDHVLSTGRDVNILVLDTEVYSNTGGQQSKSTPLAASAKFAAAGKTTPKKDLARMAMSYGNVYVGTIAFGAKDVQTVKTFMEAESYPGTSLIIAYSHCIAHGYDLAYGAEQQKLAVDTGYWPLFRYDPRRREQGLNPLQLDSGAPKPGLDQYLHNETRFRMVRQQDPERFRILSGRLREGIKDRYETLEQMAAQKMPTVAAAVAEIQRGGTGNGNGNGNSAKADTAGTAKE